MYCFCILVCTLLTDVCIFSATRGTRVKLTSLIGHLNRKYLWCHKILTSKSVSTYQNIKILVCCINCTLCNLAYHLLQLIIVTGISFNLIALLEPKLLCFFQYNGNRHIASFFVQYYSEKSFWAIILHMCHITQYLFTKKIIKMKNKTFSIS